MGYKNIYKQTEMAKTGITFRLTKGSALTYEELDNNFTYLNGQDAVSTREASNFQTTSSNQKRSKKEEMLDQQMEQYMKSRDHARTYRVTHSRLLA